MKKVVDPRYAKSGEYGGVIRTILKQGKCPFCPENFLYHKHAILKRAGGWFITNSSWPYPNTRHHFLIIGSAHKEQLMELTSHDFKAIHQLASWAIKKFDLRGGALTMRFGATEYTGATVCHLHFHLIVPKRSKSVSFPIG